MTAEIGQVQERFNVGNNIQGVQNASSGSQINNDTGSSPYTKASYQLLLN